MLRNLRRGKKRGEIEQSDFPMDIVSIIWTSHKSIDYDNAFSACKLETEETAFIARGYVQHRLVTGFTTKNASQAYFPYNSSEHVLDEFEVLSTEHPESLHWVQDHGGHVPKSAVLGGLDHEHLYIGRTCTPLNNAQTYDGYPLTVHRCAEGGKRVGKIHPSHRCLYIPYVSKEYIFPEYEVLCHKLSPGNLMAICKWKILNSLKKNGLKKAVINELPLPVMLKDYLKNN